MLHKVSQGMGRWWVAARLRNHFRTNARVWVLLGGFAALWLMLILAVTLLGRLFNDGSDKWKVVPVSGQVLLDGQPLTSGIVKFHPDASQKNNIPFSPSGEIDANGHYELHTGSKKGAPPGWYRVVIAEIETADNSKGIHKDAKPPFNAKFSRDDETPLIMEVKENGDYTLKLTK